jgi:hypothetical protein
LNLKTAGGGIVSILSEKVINGSRYIEIDSPLLSTKFIQKYRALHPPSTISSSPMVAGDSLFENMGKDVFGQLIKSGQIEGPDVIRLCATSKKIRGWCDQDFYTRIMPNGVHGLIKDMPDGTWKTVYKDAKLSYEQYYYPRAYFAGKIYLTIYGIPHYTYSPKLGVIHKIALGGTQSRAVILNKSGELFHVTGGYSNLTIMTEPFEATKVLSLTKMMNTSEIFDKALEFKSFYSPKTMGTYYSIIDKNNEVWLYVDMYINSFNTNNQTATKHWNRLETHSISTNPKMKDIFIRASKTSNGNINDPKIIEIVVVDISGKVWNTKRYKDEPFIEVQTFEPISRIISFEQSDIMYMIAVSGKVYGYTYEFGQSLIYNYGITKYMSVVKNVVDISEVLILSGPNNIVGQWYTVLVTSDGEVYREIISDEYINTSGVECDMYQDAPEPDKQSIYNDTMYHADYKLYEDAPPNVSKIVSGSSHTLYLTKDGEVYIQGKNEENQLMFFDTMGSLSKPTLYEGFTGKVKEIYAFNRSSAFII